MIPWTVPGTEKLLSVVFKKFFFLGILELYTEYFCNETSSIQLLVFREIDIHTDRQVDKRTNCGQYARFLQSLENCLKTITVKKEDMRVIITKDKLNRYKYIICAMIKMLTKKPR